MNLSGAQLWVLQRIGRTPGISLTELAAQTLTNSSTVSEVTARMVKAGYVKRVAQPSDARRVHLTLTPRGAAILRGLTQPVQERLANALRGLPSQKLSLLADTFEEWVANAKLQRSPAAMLDSRLRA